MVVPFDEAQAAESPESFVDRVLVRCLRTRVIVVGEDFHFGRHRDGNVDLLRKLGAESRLRRRADPAASQRRDGVDEPVSSTAIRRALAGGDIARANAMLGRPYEVRGDGVRQATSAAACSASRRPTSVCRTGCACPPTVCTPGWYERPNGDVHACAINLGRRPTFYEHADASLLEAHLLDVDVDLYGETAEVRFTHFLRSERKFDGVDALIAQLEPRRRPRPPAPRHLTPDA